MAIRLIPDSLALTVDYLKGHASIIALATAARVSPELPPNAFPTGGTLPYLTVMLLAGVEKDQGYLDEAYLDLSAWGSTAPQANLLIRTARAVMMDAHLVTHTRGVVSRPRTVLPPRWLPDDSINPPRPRYVTTVALTLHQPLL